MRFSVLPLVVVFTLTSCGETSSDSMASSGGSLGEGGLGSGTGGAPGAGGRASTSAGGEIGLPPGHYCGDGIVDKIEYCDDGNSVPWDGCTLCMQKGELLWTVPGCDGSVFPGKDSSFLVLCSDPKKLFERYLTFIPSTPMASLQLRGEAGPPQPTRADGTPIAPTALLELEDGRLFVAGGLNEGIRALDAAGGELWSYAFGDASTPYEVLALAAAGDWIGATGRVGVNPFVAVFALDGAPANKAIVPTDSVAFGSVLALSEDGSSFAGGMTAMALDVNRAAVWAHDAAGTLLWTWLNDENVRIGRILDIRLQDQRVRLLVSQSGGPGDDTWQLKTLDATTGAELDSRILGSGPATNGNSAMGGKFAHSDAFDSYLYGDAVLGFDAQGKEIFRGNLGFANTGDSTIAVQGLICQVGPRQNYAEPGPLCYLTQ